MAALGKFREGDGTRYPITAGDQRLISVASGEDQKYERKRDLNWENNQCCEGSITTKNINSCLRRFEGTWWSSRKPCLLQEFSSLGNSWVHSFKIQSSGRPTRKLSWQHKWGGAAPSSSLGVTSPGCVNAWTASATVEFGVWEQSFSRRRCCSGNLHQVQLWFNIFLSLLNKKEEETYEVVNSQQVSRCSQQGEGLVYTKHEDLKEEL